MTIDGFLLSISCLVVRAAGSAVMVLSSSADVRHPAEFLSGCSEYAAGELMSVSYKVTANNSEINKLKGPHAEHGFVFSLEPNQLECGNFKIPLLLGAQT